MPPRRNRQQELDFTIHVDPSCASGPVEENMDTTERRGGSVEYPAMDPWNEEVGDVGSDESTPLVETDGAIEDELRAGLHHEGDIDGEADSEGSHSRRESAFSMASHDSGGRESLQEDDSYFSESERQSYGDVSLTDEGHVSEQTYHQPSVADEGGDSSSHHENEDDVFSDNSPRSSMGSASDIDQAKAKAKEQVLETRSPRISGFSQYEPDEFIPMKRETPRPAFRSPSSVRAMQMTSPPPSTMGSPRSSRRTPKQTISRLGSPSVSAQYSPKKTPPRFKRNTPPLVLLHVTLLPLRWAWGDVLDNAQTSDLTEEGKTLREAWRHLQDRTGDTVSDRGILLPHPQNDFEVLEERLLEALELPVRRRARILECGHYLGPANEMSLEEESEDEYDETKSPRPSISKTTHWCCTCEGEIRYDSLGPGKVFRVKVYASNGLMRAGAWEACWKEMERVDVEVEPLVDHRMLEELGHLAAEQERALEMQEAEEILAEAGGNPDEHRDEHREESSFMEEPSQPQVLHSSPQPEIHLDSSPIYEDRRRREEERLREIYGQTPPTQPEPTSTKPRVSDYDPQETPPSPSAEAFERLQTRRQADKTASLPELVLEAVRVVMQDRKNIMIALLSVLILALAARSGPQQDPAFTVIDTPVVQESKETGSPGYTPWDSATTGAGDPCVPCSLALEEAQASVMEMQATVSIETVTQTVFETSTATVMAAPTAMQTPFEAETVESVYDGVVDGGNEEVEGGGDAEDDAREDGEGAEPEL